MGILLRLQRLRPERLMNSAYFVPGAAHLGGLLHFQAMAGVDPVARGLYANDKVVNFLGDCAADDAATSFNRCFTDLPRAVQKGASNHKVFTCDFNGLAGIFKLVGIGCDTGNCTKLLESAAGDHDQGLLKVCQLFRCDDSVFQDCLDTMGQYIGRPDVSQVACSAQPGGEVAHLFFVQFGVCQDAVKHRNEVLYCAVRVITIAAGSVADNAVDQLASVLKLIFGDDSIAQNIAQLVLQVIEVAIAAQQVVVLFDPAIQAGQFVCIDGVVCCQPFAQSKQLDERFICVLATPKLNFWLPVDVLFHANRLCFFMNSVPIEASTCNLSIEPADYRLEAAA